MRWRIDRERGSLRDRVTRPRSKTRLDPPSRMWLCQEARSAGKRRCYVCRLRKCRSRYGRTGYSEPSQARWPQTSRTPSLGLSDTLGRGCRAAFRTRCKRTPLRSQALPIRGPRSRLANSSRNSPGVSVVRTAPSRFGLSRSEGVPAAGTRPRGFRGFGDTSAGQVERRWELPALLSGLTYLRD